MNQYFMGPVHRYYTVTDKQGLRQEQEQEWSGDGANF